MFYYVAVSSLVVLFISFLGGFVSRGQVTDQTTVRELFKWLTLQGQDYRCDLVEGRLQAIISRCFNLTFNQARQALVELEKRNFIEITRIDIENWRVNILKRDWMAAPNILI